MMTKSSRASAAAAAILCLLFAHVAPAAVPVSDLRFQVTQLVPPPNYGLNLAVGDLVASTGWVAGYGSSLDGAIRFDASGTGTLLQNPSGQGSVPRAFGINRLSEVVGSYQPSGNTERPLKWSAAGSVTLLASGTFDYASARTLNDVGMSAGYVTNSATPRPAMWNAAGSLQTLPVPASYDGGRILNINNTGEMAGSLIVSGGYVAARWSIGGTVTPLQKPPGFNLTEGFGINAGNTVVGYGQVSASYRGVRWDAAGTSMVLLGPQGQQIATHAWGIDDDGRMVGIANVAGDTACLWDTDGSCSLIQNLLAPGTPSYHFTQSYGIDSDGQNVRVVVSTSSIAGITGYYLLTAPLPEPSMAVACAVPLSWVAIRRRKRQL